MPNIEIASEEFMSANILKVSAGTNTPKGGDTGAGGRTYIKLKDEASTDLRVRVKGRLDGDYYFDDVDEIELILGGDTEANTFIDSLEFALKTLKRQQEANHYERNHLKETIEVE